MLKNGQFLKDQQLHFLLILFTDPQGNGIKVVKAPKLVKILPMEKMLPFEMDKEYAGFAVKAIPDLSKLSKKIGKVKCLIRNSPPDGKP